MRAIDCMGFAGGFTTGVVQAGFDLIAKREMEAGFGVANCEANRHVLGYGWQTETCSASEWSVPDGGAEFLFGNPPCSGFSVMSAKSFRGMNSPINHCMWAFADYASRVKPLIAVFESVRAAYKTGHLLMKDLRARLEARTGQTWTLYHVIHDAHALGGPAVRKRYFWVAARVPFGVEHPIIPGAVTLHDAIGDLSQLPLTWNAQLYTQPATWWSAPRRSTADIVDGHMDPRTPNAKRLADLATMVQWQPGATIVKESRRCYETYGRLPESWANQQERIVNKEFDFGFNATVRWPYDRPARVVTGAGPAIAVHPEHDRVFTHREVARIMGFPDDWVIFPIRNTPGLPATWGKGITVDAGRWIAQWVKSSIEGNSGTLPMKEVGSREYEVDVSRVLTQYDNLNWSSKEQGSNTMPRSLGGAVGRRRKHGAVKTTQDVTVQFTPPTEDDNTKEELVDNEVSAEDAAEATLIADTVESEQVSVPPAPQIPENTVAPQDSSDKPASVGRGRPRPATVIERDNAVHELVKSSNGITREQIAEHLEVESKQVYSSLYRLRRDGNVYRIRDAGAHTWYATVDDDN